MLEGVLGGPFRLAHQQIILKFGIHLFGANRCDLLDARFGAGVVANLHVSVFEEVHGMHFVVHHVMVRGHAIRDANGGEVGVDVVLPKT